MHYPNRTIDSDNGLISFKKVCIKENFRNFTVSRDQSKETRVVAYTCRYSIVDI